jgi:flagellar P-ring protein precursor FlgI
MVLSQSSGLWLAGMPMHAWGATPLRLKDITHIRGVRVNQVVGFGLVVGLNKTGDKAKATQTASFNMMNNLGGKLGNANDVKTVNTASVIVTATIPPFAKAGDRIDVLVSSMGDAKSLEGGVLIATQLQAPNGEVVGIAQGAISTGGTSVESSGSSKRTAITTTGRIPSGAIIERDIQTSIGDADSISLILNKPDFSLATTIAYEISQEVCPAKAIDPSEVRISIPSGFLNKKVELLAHVENLTVTPATEVAKVVINERTGTIVIGNNVRLLPAAVAHGGMTISISTTNSVSQPNSFGQGKTTTASNSTIDIQQASGSVIELPANSTLRDLVGALNSIGVKPGDLISILQALKEAGSLEATLEII